MKSQFFTQLFIRTSLADEPLIKREFFKITHCNPASFLNGPGCQHSLTIRERNGVVQGFTKCPRVPNKTNPRVKDVPYERTSIT